MPSAGSVPSGALIPGSDQSHLWLDSAPALELENRCVCSLLPLRTVQGVSENPVYLFSSVLLWTYGKHNLILKITIIVV